MSVFCFSALPCYLAIFYGCYRGFRPYLAHDELLAPANGEHCLRQHLVEHRQVRPGDEAGFTSQSGAQVRQRGDRAAFTMTALLVIALGKPRAHTTGQKIQSGKPRFPPLPPPAPLVNPLLPPPLLSLFLSPGLTASMRRRRSGARPGCAG